MVSIGDEKPDLELRKLIRSHVMQGKNRGRILPPRKRKPKTTEIQDIPASSHSGLEERLVRPNPSSAIVFHTAVPVTVPRKFGSSLSSVQFADAVDPGKVEVVIRR